MRTSEDLVTRTPDGLETATVKVGFETGVAWVSLNRPDKRNCMNPTLNADMHAIGGVKGSGYGRFGGKAGIAVFTDLRWITIETLPGQYPI